MRSEAQNCFSDDVADKMIVYIERCKIAEQQLVAYEGGNVELQRQIDLLKATIKSMQDLIDLQKQKEEIQKGIIEMERQYSQTKDKLCQEEIKAAKPTFMQEVGKYTMGGVLGAVLLGVFLLL